MVSTVLYYILPIFLGIALLRKYKEKTWGWCKNNVSLEGKTVLITGANTGIGYETAKELAKRKATVIFACRNLEAAAQSINKIKMAVTDCQELVAIHLDLSSLAKVRSSADEIAKKFPKIHILIDNAGMYTPNIDEKTEDGYEVHFGVNHLGPFLLTNLLLENLQRAAPSRVIVVSSLMHERGIIRLDDIAKPSAAVTHFKSKSMNAEYANSKLANAYFGRELAKKLDGTGVDVYSVCPGFTHTRLFRDVARWYHYIFFAPMAFIWMRSAKQGAQTVIYCATEPSLVGKSGHFYRNCAPYKSKVTFDQETSSGLWDVSLKLAGLK